MKIRDALQNTTRLFLDSSPVIYFSEQNPQYVNLVGPIFTLIATGYLTAVTSPVTLAECLVFPFRLGSISSQQAFLNIVTRANNTEFATINQVEAQSAAELRAKYNLPLADALQIAVALASGCQSVLTNDRDWRLVTEINVIVLDELEL